MIAVYKTNVSDRLSSKKVIVLLSNVLMKHYISIDLEDIDNVLRIEGSDFDSDYIILLLKQYGYHCEYLED